MSKYQFVLHSVECEAFVTRLRELGMVDITTSGWEPSEAERVLMVDVESRLKAERSIAEFMRGDGFDAAAEPFETGEQAYAEYERLSGLYSEMDARETELRKVVQESKPWGEFDGESLMRLDGEGLKLSYFVALESAYEAFVAEREDLTAVMINSLDGKVYFVVVTREGDASDLNIDAQLVKPLTMSSGEAEAAIVAVEAERVALSGDFSRVARSLSMIEDGRAELSERLQLSKVSHTAESAAEGSLLVMEAWAEEAKSKQVDELLDSQEGLFYIKSNPTPEDNTPVKLENNRYARLFELVGNLYALPKYGTIDLTPFFAPFYMMFFAICLCDAGYGLFILGAGLGLYFKGGESMRRAAWLSIWCGVASVIFGLLANSVFGMTMGFMPTVIDFQTDFFVASLSLGIIQILFGMLINIVVTSRSFGVKYALGSIGWFVMVFSTVVSVVLTSVGVAGFETDSMAFYAVVGAGFATLLLFNSPDKNIFANIGAGIWETYDKMTGLLGDVLSYIRLFAIGLSGGVLALVFNDLAIGLTGLDVSWDGQSVVSLVFKILAASAILLIGHGINLFMSTISSFVHPMRLTFVEFYKNAGFEMSSRKFEPLQKGEKK